MYPIIHVHEIVQEQFCAHANNDIIMHHFVQTHFMRVKTGSSAIGMSAHSYML
jgi:hypothetical protein